MRDSTTAWPFEGKTEGLPTNHRMKKITPSETAQPVTMLFVIAQPPPKSINLLAVGDTPPPSLANTEEPVRSVMKIETSLRTRDMARGTA